MENNYITTHQMLRNVISRLGLRDIHDLPLYDMISWLADGTAHIGSLKNLEEATCQVNVTNYIGEYPLDMWAIKRIEGHPLFKSTRNGFTINLKEGTVTIIYDRFPLDSEGLPLYPNTPAIVDALTFYCGKWLAIQGKLPNPQMTYEKCDKEWQWYCGQARAEGFVPSIDEWDRMVSLFYRWLPNKNEFVNNFVGLNLPEKLVIDGINEPRFGQNKASNSY